MPASAPDAAALDITALDPMDAAAVALVAARMRSTLIEVVGPERGAAMYDTDWLIDRVRQHLDGRLDGAVFLARRGDVVGHTIVRAELYEGRPIGLYSTTWVAPAARRSGVATALLDRGEAWMRGRGLPEAQTCTAVDNRGLRALYARRGYAVVARSDEMVRLARALQVGAPSRF